MAKKSKQRSARQKKDQLGCMWGIINMFDFRQGRPTRRLLSDRRRNTYNDTLGKTFVYHGNLFFFFSFKVNK